MQFVNDWGIEKGDRQRFEASKFSCRGKTTDKNQPNAPIKHHRRHSEQNMRTHCNYSHILLHWFTLGRKTKEISFMSTFGRASVMNTPVVEAQVCAAELDVVEHQHSIQAALSALIIATAFLVLSVVS